MIEDYWGNTDYLENASELPRKLLGNIRGILSEYQGYTQKIAKAHWGNARDRITRRVLIMGILGNYEDLLGGY